MLFLDLDDPRRRLRLLPPETPLLDRVLLRVTPNDVGCWLFQGSLDNGGYSVIRRRDKNYRGHVVTYEAARGPIPNGLVVDHLCRVRKCVNPDHLEAIPQRENNFVRAFWSSGYPRATHCPQGHEMTPENTYIRPDGAGRNCLECIRRRSAAVDPEMNRKKSRDYLARNRDEVNRRKRERRARAS